MTNFTTIEAEGRDRAGKGAARATRRAGKVPAVIYGAKQPATLIALDPRLVMRELHKPGWRSRLFELNLAGVPVRALIRDVQFHPVTDTVEHVDFQRLVAGEKIHVAVAVHFTNELLSPGLKRGGSLNIVRHTVEVYVDPDHIPGYFEADLTGLEFNANIRWHDLKGTENTKPTAVVDKDFVIATLSPPIKSNEPVAETAATPAKGKAAPKAAAPAKPAAKK
jgi:large subunit ribosomal protein L25